MIYTFISDQGVASASAVEAAVTASTQMLCLSVPLQTILLTPLWSWLSAHCLEGVVLPPGALCVNLDSLFITFLPRPSLMLLVARPILLPETSCWTLFSTCYSTCFLLLRLICCSKHGSISCWMSVLGIHHHHRSQVGGIPAIVVTPGSVRAPVTLLLLRLAWVAVTTNLLFGMSSFQFVTPLLALGSDRMAVVVLASGPSRAPDTILLLRSSGAAAIVALLLGPAQAPVVIFAIFGVVDAFLQRRRTPGGSLALKTIPFESGG